MRFGLLGLFAVIVLTPAMAWPAEPDDEFVSSSPANAGASFVDNVAVVYVMELHVFPKGSPNNAAPTVITLPKSVVRPPAWSGEGKLFVALSGGDVAVVERGTLRVIEIAKALRKMKPPPRRVRPRRGWDWAKSDGLFAESDGSVWMRRCRWSEGKDGSCAGAVYYRLDAAEVSRVDEEHHPHEPAPWPKIAAPGGYRAEIVEPSRWAVTCKAPGQEKRALMLRESMPHAVVAVWVTRQPARLLVRFDLRDEVVVPETGMTGGTTNVDVVSIGEATVLSTECGAFVRAEGVAGSGGLYAFGVEGAWTLGYDGVAVREFPGALMVALGRTR